MSLTDERINEIFNSHRSHQTFARAIERELGKREPCPNCISLLTGQINLAEICAKQHAKIAELIEELNYVNQNKASNTQLPK